MRRFIDYIIEGLATVMGVLTGLVLIGLNKLGEVSRR